MAVSNVTARWGLPMLAAGQAQKEITHNEALMLADMLLNPRVVAAGVSVPPVSPIAGAAWIVGTAPTGAWAGRADSLAGWTSGGWRFAPPSNGLRVWDEATSSFLVYKGSGWIAAPAIADASGGTVIDSQLRAVVASLLTTLRGQGVLKS